jgi:SPP1 family predicted phage head-tail adaptor
MLSNAEIQSMREVLARTFTSTATCLRKSNSSDGRGGRVVTWQSAFTFKSRLSTSPPGQRQNVELGAVISDQGYLLSYPHDVGITAADRIQIGDVVYEVVAVFENSNWDLHGRAHLRRIV